MKVPTFASLQNVGRLFAHLNKLKKNLAKGNLLEAGNNAIKTMNTLNKVVQEIKENKSQEITIRQIKNDR